MRKQSIGNVFLIVFMSGVVLFFSACRPDPETKLESGIIYVTVFQNGTPLIESEEIVLDSSDADRSVIHIYLQDPDLYDAGSIFWRIPGTDITAEGTVFSLEAIWFKNPGAYYVNVAVKINGVPFNNVFELRVLGEGVE